MLMGVTFVIIMGIFIKCCAVHTPSSNPKKPPARRFSETLRRPITTLRRMVILFYIISSFNFLILWLIMFLYSGTIPKHMSHSLDQVEFQLMVMVKVEVIIMHQEVTTYMTKIIFLFHIFLLFYFIASAPPAHGHSDRRNAFPMRHQPQQKVW